ncbi:MAG: phytoene desaturase family protein [Candidatus Nanopelagicales bacterium]
MARVVVIGAGMGGMAAAARLRVKGHHVTVVEASDTHGGKLGTLRRDGYAFDTGPSLFTLPAVYRDLFLKTGAPLEDSVELVPLDPGFTYRFADGTHLPMPGAGVGLGATAMGDAFGGRAATDWRALQERAGRMWATTRRPFLESPLTGARDLLPLARDLGAVRTVAPWQTLRSLGRHTLSDWRARQVLDRYATYSGSDPRRAPAVLATIPYIEATFGAWHIAGGLRSLGDALRTRLDERGVTVRLLTPAIRIELDSAGRVSGVQLADGEVLPADVVVANADARSVYGPLLGARAPKGPLRRLNRATPSLSGFVMLLAVQGRTPGLTHNNVWFPAEYDPEFDAIFGRSPAPVDDPTIYACVPDDPAMRPADGESWFVLVNAPRHSPGGRQRGTMDWDVPGLAHAYADRVLARLAERGTDLTGRIRWRELRTPADLQRATGAPGGAIYGTSSNGTRAAFLRPQNASPVPGLFLVGGSAHPGGGLPLVGMSAEIVADLIGRA